jgi:hypothetical protein
MLMLIGSLALAGIALAAAAPGAADDQIERGELDQSRLLQGAPVPLKSPFPSQTWAFEAPKIAGLPGGWTEADLIQLLQTGKGPRGRSPQPPMPPFRLSQADATAIAAYLKSLQ